jgi:hypothetical protein
MPLYFLHQTYYQQMNRFLINYKESNKSAPSTEVFRKKALEVLDAL